MEMGKGWSGTKWQPLVIQISENTSLQADPLGYSHTVTCRAAMFSYVVKCERTWSQRSTT